MDFFFQPRGIALIGATPNPQKGGNAILRNLLKGFRGAVYPVNPRYETIEGVRCWPSVDGLPDPLDLAIVFVPALHVPEIIRRCAARGIRGVMIESSGFAEAGPQGAARQAELAAIARETGIRLWGPNCMGLVDAHAGYVFSFVSPAIWEEGLIPGKVSLVVQSGLLSGGFLIDLATHGTAGVSKVCSVGNKVDVNECDLLAYLLADPATAAVGLYLEAIPEGRRFLELCRGSAKPIVVLKGGKSPGGAAAARSHTASMAGNGAVVSGALAQVGVVEAAGFKQMMDFCRTLAEYPRVPAAVRGRVAILTYSGGSGIVSADGLDALGVPLARLADDTLAEIKRVFPDWMPVSNPVDLWPAVEQNGAQTVFSAAARAALADPGVDALFIHAFAGGFALEVDLREIAADARRRGKPVICWLLGAREPSRRFQTTAQALGIPVLREIPRAVECLKTIFTRRAVSIPPPADTPLPSTVAERLGSARGALDEHRSKKVLADCGIPVVAEGIVATPAAAAAAAAKWGYPVVLKGLVPGAVHKTEQGLVRLGIASAAALESAFGELAAAMNGAGEILLQQMVHGGPELIAGGLRDPQFGPCVMCGLGGTLAEILGDAAFAVAPLSREDALALVGRLKTRQLLDGFRGAPPVDREALAEILVRLGRLMAAFPAIREIDINPLICANGRPLAVDASIILAD
ncbi:MAG: acetate--CoA ligase family protein [Desulfobacteraceae bacterium]|jgi:acetyltransferase